jgi:hypothetical protein
MRRLGSSGGGGIGSRSTGALGRRRCDTGQHQLPAVPRARTELGPRTLGRQCSGDARSHASGQHGAKHGLGQQRIEPGTFFAQHNERLHQG